MLAKKLGIHRPEKTVEQNSGGARIGIKAGVEIGVQGQSGQQREYRGDSVVEILQEVADSKGVLLILDEAQNLKVGVQTKESEKADISHTLDLIHNGDIGAPVVLVAGGLGSTESVLETFGISRIPVKKVCHLGLLDNEATQAVVRDWLVWAGGVSEDHPHLPAWVEHIATHSQGWPQHIHVFAQAASQWLVRHGSQLTVNVPGPIIAEALRDEQYYYSMRANRLDEPFRGYVAHLLKKKGKGIPLTKSELLDALSVSQTREEAEDMFAESLVHKGVVARTLDGDYIIPVPSMHDWLVEKYAAPV